MSSMVHDNSTFENFTNYDHLLNYCTNPINSLVMHHRGSEIDKILRGHRSQGPPTKPPGQSKIGVKNRFFSPPKSSNLKFE